MKITNLQIYNFRQFNGEHEVKFSTDGERNITVIHGENGSGKTTILNAFKYCFYGETDFDTKNENILNQQAIRDANIGDRLTLKITIGFEHEDLTYRAERENIFQVTNSNGEASARQSGKSKFALWKISSDGEAKQSDSPETTMNQILPENMHPFFFFNGERIEKLAAVSQNYEIQEAIKNLMGLELVERASDHLQTKVRRHFKDKIKERSTDEIKSLIEEEDKREDELEEFKKNLNEANKNISQYKIDLEEINKKLSILKETSALQEQRIEEENTINSCTDKINQISNQRKLLISEKGFLALSKDMFKYSGDLLEAKRKKGDLPYKIKEQFINDILANGVCICGRDIHEHSPEYDNINSYRKEAGNSDMENEFILTSGACKQTDKEYSNFYTKLSDLNQERAEYENKKEQSKRKLDEISHKIQHVDQEDISSLEGNREKINREIQELSGDIGFYKGKIKEIQNDLKEIATKRGKLEDKKKRQEIYHRRLELTNKLQKVIEELYETLANEVRKALSEKVNNTFRDIIRKPYYAEIDDDYCLQIYKEDEGLRSKIIEKSTGENQVTSLSFIGSIISHAKKRYETEHVFYRGGLFPLVMDSPFGALDKDYREKISRYIPELAEQVIILVSNSQWEGNVEDQCRSRIGKEWNLIYYSPEISQDNETHYVKCSAGEEYTLIQENEYGR